MVFSKLSVVAAAASIAVCLGSVAAVEAAAASASASAGDAIGNDPSSSMIRKVASLALSSSSELVSSSHLQGSDLAEAARVAVSGKRRWMNGEKKKNKKEAFSCSFGLISIFDTTGLLFASPFSFFFF